MAKIHGKFGKVTMGGAVLANCNHWSLSTTGDAEEATDFNSAGWKEYLAGNNGFTAAADGWWSTTEPALVGTTPALSAGLTVTLLLGTTASTDDDYSLSAIITGVDFDCDVNANVTWKATFQGTGAITAYPT